MSRTSIATPRRAQIAHLQGTVEIVADAVVVPVVAAVPEAAVVVVADAAGAEAVLVAVVATEDTAAVVTSKLPLNLPITAHDQGCEYSQPFLSLDDGRALLV